MTFASLTDTIIIYGVGGVILLGFMIGMLSLAYAIWMAVEAAMLAAYRCWLDLRARSTTKDK